MHIPASMLNGAICPATAVVSAVGLGAAAISAAKSENKPTASKFAAVTSLIFALQMLNYPVQDGTSGHLLGALLGVSLLGVPFAVLSTAIVLIIQAVFFGDGGINALGANILNISLIGAGLLGYVFHRMQQKGINKHVALGIAAFVSVLAGAFACSVEVAMSGTVNFHKVLPAMLSVHTLIGVGEAALTIAVVAVLNSYASRYQQKERQFAVGAFGLATIAAIASPLASGFPDGLEWVAERLSFAEFGGFQVPAMFPDYQVSFIGSPAFSTSIAGLVGVALVYALTWMVGKGLDRTEMKIAA
jgi:cobalt/nickel transport system permease protein